VHLLKTNKTLMYILLSSRSFGYQRQLSSETVSTSHCS